MTPSATAAPTLSPEQTGELLSLARSSDSVELKLTVPETQHRSTAVALGMDPLEAQIRQVFFFDTPDLALDEAGVVVRARRIQGKGGDSAVKLRPVVPDELPTSLRRSPSFRVEVDALPGGFVCSGALKSAVGTEDVKTGRRRRAAVRKLFSKEQRAFYAEHAPEGSSWTTCPSSGPILVLKLRFTPEGLGRRLVAEMWLYPDGSRILELSTRCAHARGVPGGGRAARVPRQPRRRPLGRAADQDPQGAPVLRQGPETRMIDRPPLGVADVRRRLRRRRRPLRRGSRPSESRRATRSTCSSARSDASVKVRDGLMDVKHLERVDDDGLEQWRPVLKAAFPLAAADVARPSWTPSASRRRRSDAPTAYTLDELVRLDGRTLLAVEVHKRREHYTVGGCMAELSEVRTAQGATRTIAVESEDPALRDRRRARARPGDAPERQYGARAQGARRLRRAALRGHRRRHELGQVPHRRARRRRRLAHGRRPRRGHAARRGPGRDRASSATSRSRGPSTAIAGMAEEAGATASRRSRPSAPPGCASPPTARTSSTRVRERTASRSRSSPARRRRRLAYLAATSGLGSRGGSLVVFDTGGGSSQFTFGRGGHIDEQFSVNVGAARFTEQFGLDRRWPRRRSPPPAKRSPPTSRGSTAGRPPTCSSAWAARSRTSPPSSTGWRRYDPDVVQGTVLEAAEIDRQIELYRTRSADERRADRRAAAQARGGHPGRRLHRPHGVRKLAGSR